MTSEYAGPGDCVHLRCGRGRRAGGPISANNAFIKEVHFPRRDNDAPADSDILHFTYYSDGSVASRTDQRGMVFTHSYDELGRRVTSTIDDTAWYGVPRGQTDHLPPNCVRRLISASLDRLATDGQGQPLLDAGGRPYLVEPDGTNGAPVPRGTAWNLDHLGNWAGGEEDEQGIIRSLVRTGDFDGDGVADDPRYVHHAVNQANEIAALHASAGTTPGTPTDFVYDPAGNLTYDGLYVYQYDP